MVRILLSTLVAVVLSLLVALRRLHQLPRTNGLKIGIDIGFIIPFL
jgi:hypothetical protein